MHILISEQIKETFAYELQKFRSAGYRYGSVLRLRQKSDISGPGPVVRPVANFCFDDNDPRFPIGMGYVPMQMWGTIYPLARGFVRGTIFPSLDLPFAVGRCRR